MATLQELREIRIEKMNKLVKSGVKPFPAKSNRDTSTADIRDKFGEFEGKEVVVAGRLMSLREHGALTFGDLQDSSGRIQLYIKSENLTEEKLSETNDYFPYESLDLLDMGDHIEAFGTVTKTKRGEISVEVSKIRMLAKSIRPLPEKWSGLTDIERRYRRRYLDMTINPEVREVLQKKGLFIQHIRDFMLQQEFNEVETPILESITGGAEANPFITHHNALNIDMYLRISLELPLKRLVAGGMEKVFEIGRVFRNEGMSMMHLQHYTQMEFYWAYADFEMLVDFVEKLYAYAIEKTFGTLKLNWQGTDLDFTPPWPRIDYQVEFLEKNGIDLSKDFTLEQLLKRAKEVGVEDLENADKGRLIDSIYKKTIRPNIIQPSLLVNHPVIISPLSKRDDNNPNIVKRFQPVMLGAELGNGWNELNDPIDQFNRFKEQQALIDNGDDEAMMMDIDYVEALEYGMPPTAGFGVGIDRLFMYLADLPSIRDTLFFPIMRPRISSVSQEIYGLDIHIYKDLVDPTFMYIDKSVKELDQTYAVTVAKLKLSNIKHDKEDIENLRVRAIEKFNKAEVDFDNNERVIAYRNIFQNMGLDKKTAVPYAERLLKFTLENMDFEEMGLVLDLANVSTISHGVSIGIMDATKVVGAIVVKIADKDYLMVDTHGDEVNIKAGTLCYFDDEGPIRAKLNMYTANRVGVTEDTNELIVFVDKIDGIDQELADRVMRHFTSDLNNFGNISLQKSGVVRQQNSEQEKDGDSDKKEAKTVNIKNINVDNINPNELLEKYIESESLRKHCYSVESAMRFYAKRLDPKNEEKWAQAGLLHDLDWEKYPEDHPLKSKEILPEHGFNDEEVINAILAHYEEKTGVKPTSLMDKCLLACDEVTGLVTATSLMRPSGISDLAYKSVKKKMKSKGFAKGVDRELVMNAFEDFNSSLDNKIEFSEHVDNIIGAMREDERLGL